MFHDTESSDETFPHREGYLCALYSVTKFVLILTETSRPLRLHVHGRPRFLPQMVTRQAPSKVEEAL